MYGSSTKETKWVCIQLACSRRPRAFEEAHCWNIQAKFYNEKFPLVYESDNIRDSLHEEHGATLKHKYGKRQQHCPFLFSFLLFWAFFWPFYYIWDNALKNDDHHTSIFLQLNGYNSILEQKMTLYEDLRRCTGMSNESRVTCMKIMHGGFATNTMSTT